MADQTPLQEAALSLRAHAPDAWDKFMQALHERTVKASMDMTRASPDVLLKAQGMAIQAQDLFEELRDAPKANARRR